MLIAGGMVAPVFRNNVGGLAYPYDRVEVAVAVEVRELGLLRSPGSTPLKGLGAGPLV